MLTSLERAVIDLLLTEQGEPNDTIRLQVKNANIANRELTGVGFFTKFELPVTSSVRRDLPNCTISGVEAELPGLKHGAGFLLFIRDGVVSQLEGFTYDEPWPMTIDSFKLWRH